MTKLIKKKYKNAKKKKSKWSAMKTDDKILYLMASPFNFIRDYSIPFSDEEFWDKKKAIIHPLTVSLFLILVKNCSFFFFFSQINN